MTPEEVTETANESSAETTPEVIIETSSEQDAQARQPLAMTSPASITFIEDDVDFEKLFDEEMRSFDEHQIVTGKIIEMQKDFITVDIGYKSEGQIPSEEFRDENGVITVKEGDEVEVYLEATEDSDGVVVLSKIKAEKMRVWEEVGRIYEEDGTVEGIISSRIKGGLSVDIGVKAFLPGSQVDLRPVRNLDKLIGEKFEFKILKFNQKRGNIVLSRRALLEVDREERRKKTLEVLQEGSVIKGFVKNITDYGVFIDLGGVDGLLHITDMTWGRIVHPSEMFSIGDEVEVMVLKYDDSDEKVSLGLKQKTSNPWDAVREKYPIGAKVGGKIVSLTDYGAFIELEPGVEGLIHVTEMSWTRKIRHPSKLFNISDNVEAVVKDLDIERKRISLSIKEAEPNPWETIHTKFPVGSVVRGKVRNITDFGIFVGLDEGIDGLVHVSDLSWSQRQRKPSAFAKKGDEIEVKILHIDPDKERLSLGIKQLTEDPWKSLEDKVHINDEVVGRIVNVTDFGIFVEVMEGVEGLVHISEIDQEIPKEKIGEFYKINSLLRSKVIKVDVEERRLGLGIVGLVDSPEEIVQENEVLKGALADAGVIKLQDDEGESAKEEKPKKKPAKKAKADEAAEGAEEATAEAAAPAEETPQEPAAEAAAEAAAAPEEETKEAAKPKKKSAKKDEADEEPSE
ncbi:MAG: 30S ribosomal protein S1 [Deltaproteobacteria bacterium]|nr:30S ribosomal protein S1 [Deltaproteobacteria bacterium]